MTTPTPTQAEREAAEDIAKYFGYSVSDKVRERILETLAAHRAGTPPEPAPKGDPAQAHATELETVLAACKLQMIQHGNDTNWDCDIKQEYIDALNAARALLARLDAERSKAQEMT